MRITQAARPSNSAATLQSLSLDLAVITAPLEDKPANFLRWLVASLCLHAIVLTLFWLPDEEAVQVPQVMAVSLLPMSPPAPTPPAPPQQQPAPPKPVAKAPAIIKQAQTTPAPTAISDTQPTQSNTQPTPASAVAPSGSGKPTAELPFTPAHNAAYLNNPKPTYPAMSRRLAEQGTVNYEVHVLANGQPAEVRIARSSGFPRLDEAGRDTILKYWRFEPARRGGEPVAQTVIIPMPFVLEK